MSTSAPTANPPFQVLTGGRQSSDSIAGCRIVIAPEYDPPFSVDATVCEEDTWLTLSHRTSLITASEHPLRVMTRVWESQPEPPGTVILKPGSPTRLLAVVHDLDVEPSWREEWIEAALDEILSCAGEHGFRSLKLPLLGSRLGGLSAPRFMRILRAALEKTTEASREPLPVCRIWLLRETESGAELLRALTDRP